MIPTGTSGPEPVDAGFAGDVVMYDGRVRVRFDEVLHQYLVQDLDDGPDWFRAPSVTTILGRMLDRSKMLVPWSTRLSMKTFLGRVEPGKAYTSEELVRTGYQIKDAHKLALHQAGQTGSAIHKWVQDYIAARERGGGFPVPPTDPKVRSGCSAARKWITQVNLKPIAVEKILYSRLHGFIGTTDLAAAAVINGRSACCDWKSSNQLHASYRLQLAAYQYAYEEMTGIHLEDRWLIRLDKDDSSFEAKLLPVETAQDEQDAFVFLVEAYKILDGVKFFEEH